MAWKKDDRATANQRGYGIVWKSVRLMKLRETPLCEACHGLKPARIVHHIDENPHNNSADNLRSLCFVCHEKIHGRMKDPPGVGDDGYPLDPRHPWAKKGE